VRSVFFVAASVACALAYLFPYLHLAGSWWRFIPSTVIILAIGTVLRGKGAVRCFGLAMTRRDLALSVALLALVLPLFYGVLSEVVVDEALIARRVLAPRAKVHQFFQVFNDEILMRAALLTLLLQVFPYPKAVIVGLALVFSGGHRVVYGLDGTEIGFPALTTLFSLGVIANALFVRFRHIGFGFALHYAWNFWRFGTRYYLDGRHLLEGETFNYLEGNPWVVGGSVVTMLCVCAAQISWAQRRSYSPGGRRGCQRR